MEESAETIKGLRVWNSKNNGDMFWCPEFGDLAEPLGWEFVPSGNAFLTRTMKKLGPHWILLRRDGKYTYNVGILCPIDNIAKARELETQSQSKREERREKSRKYRDKSELNYRKEVEELMFSHLDFSERYSKLAHQICSRAAEHATIVGSGRVGRTKQVPLEHRAILAVRAHIRHAYTRYEEKLAKESMFDLDGEMHAILKGEANEEVDQFIWKHRDHKK